MSSLKDQILKLLLQEKYLTISEIARRLNYAKSTVSETLSKLEEEGYVKKIRRDGFTQVVLGSRVVTLGLIKATEYIYAMPFVEELESRNFKVFIKTYNNALELCRDLLNGNVLIAYLPIVTAYITHLINSSIKLLGFGVSGGAYVLKAKHVKSSGLGKVASTKLSTMELCLTKVKELKNFEVIYANSGQEILNLLLNGDVEFGILWQPYALIAIKHGCSIYTTCSEVGVDVCCVPVINVDLTQIEILTTLKSIYVKSMSKLSQVDLTKFIGKYSKVIGLNEDLILKSYKTYSVYLGDVKEYIAKNLSDLLSLPSLKLSLIDF